MKKYNLAVLVDNKPGVLTHVSGLISRRAFNIESISAGYTEENSVTRINIEVSVEDHRELDQVRGRALHGRVDRVAFGALTRRRIA